MVWEPTKNYATTYSFDATTLNATGATAVNFTAGSVVFTLGDGSGAPSVVVDKDGLSTSTISWRSDSGATAGSTRITHDSAEQWNLETYYSAAWRTIISSSSSTGAVEVSTGAVDHSTTVGSTTGASETALQAGTDGVSIITDGAADKVIVRRSEEPSCRERV